MVPLLAPWLHLRTMSWSFPAMADASYHPWQPDTYHQRHQAHGARRHHPLVWIAGAVALGIAADRWTDRLL